MRSNLRRGLTTLGLACMLAPSLARADTYPSQPIKLVVAFAPGTGSDILGRLLAVRLSEQLRVPVTVENRAGAGGTLGTQSVAKAPADGYTLTLATNATLITSPLLSSQPTYRADRDFTPLGGVGRTPLVVVTSVNPDAPRSFRELVARARDKDKPSSFSSAGVGTIGHLTSEVVIKQAEMNSKHVPYKGSGQSLTDVVRGEILFSSDTPPAVLPLVKGGKLRALAVTGDKRLQVLPDTPTLQESGLAGINLSVWWGLMAPAGLPAPVAERLGSELAKVVAHPDMRRKMQEMELEPMPMTGAELAAYIRTEYPFWQQFLSKSGIKLE
ncbi:Bug family tripartite tricarboxylate transporter substrate binding protein [Ramlibacter sp. MAHUQ-53]|uniref:Bug family tripartite tricarboxylate transporter substrate binding protein n=1 Tax=unclassified Ramlibacter TaxID=2617605 RepID=UPI003630F601